MKKLILLFIPLFIIACGNNPEVIEDMGDASFQLVNSDSAEVVFPDDFEGDYVVMGFIYTNCPDICSLITQNLVKIQKELNYPEDVQFVAATFDPVRDTPSKLKQYGKAFEVDENFTFITGDSTEVFALMDSARVRSQVSFTQQTESGKELYFINHSDKIMVLDKQARVIFEYGGSQPIIPSLVVEDLNKVR
ncbi:MAG: SCO family protein [Gracilimonas sp.]|uniref:SCO family protein n=1 Tax=Gracilimonas TaxID=649462 RepID=UPI001B059E48|nr:SCO family protein [Gracilimonas sp.]MBO6584631.1 SCO family protein [Gracilimonas sp.]MBO6616098.1 SCO family protein [Gracilimonas sp.]